MRFICKAQDYAMCIHTEQVAYRQLANGAVDREIIKPLLMIGFNGNEMIPTYERMYALQVFMEGDTRPFGAMPEFQSQPIVDFAGRVVDMTAEYRPDFHFSVFDTETMCAPEDREEIEQKLLNDASYGKDYILVEKQKITPPWPTYNECDLATAKNMLTHGGYDLLKVLEYEEANAGREDWLKEIANLLAARSIEKAAADALSTIVK